MNPQWNVDHEQILKDMRQMIVADIWPTRPITWVSSTCKLYEALQMLKKLKVLSLPVVDVANNACVGVVDVLDIALYIVACFPSIHAITYEALVSLDYQGRKFMHDTDVAQVVAFSKAWNPSNFKLFPLNVHRPLIELVDLFAGGMHRVPIVDDNRSVINFISQMDLLRFLTENIYLLQTRGLANKTLLDLGLGRNRVYFVRSDAMTLLAMAAIAEKKYEEGVKRDTGKLVANFSASDLRGIGPTELPVLLQPLITFLSIRNVKSLYPLTCKLTDTFEHVILKLAGAKVDSEKTVQVHRLWVVDDNMQLLGVVSLTDVMFPFLGIEPMEVQEAYTTPETPGLYLGGTVTTQ